jgi:hypothetical protein
MAKARKQKALPLSSQDASPQRDLISDRSVVDFFWQSSLFNEEYLRNGVPIIYSEKWENTEIGQFATFCNEFQNLCVALKDEHDQ